MEVKFSVPDLLGYYGDFGGAFIPEMLHGNVENLRTRYLSIIEDKVFQADYDRLLQNPDETAFASIILCLMIFLTRVRSIVMAWRSALEMPQPETIQELVKTGIISLPLFDMLLVLGTTNIPAASIILAIWMSARLTARSLYTT